MQTLRSRTTKYTKKNLPSQDLLVRNRFGKYKLQQRRAATRPRLARQHHIHKLALAREHLSWDTVLFTEESKFTLSTNDHRVRVYRRPRTRFVEELDAYKGGVMIWGGINIYGRTDLHIVQHGTQNDNNYITDILQKYAIAFAPFVRDNFILMSV